MYTQKKWENDPAVNKFFKEYPNHRDHFYELLRRAATTTVDGKPNLRAQIKHMTRKEAKKLLAITIKKKIEEFNITELEFAERFNFNRHLINDWKRGRYLPNFQNLIRLKKIGIDYPSEIEQFARKYNTPPGIKKSITSERNTASSQETFGALIRRKRLASGLNRDDFAEKLGTFSAASVWQWEKNRNLPSQEYMQQLVDKDILTKEDVKKYISKKLLHHTPKLNWKKHFYDRFTLVHMPGKAEGYTGDDWKVKAGEPVKPSAVVKFIEEILQRYGIKVPNAGEETTATGK